MSELLSFTSMDKRFKFTVKSEFQEKCPDMTTIKTFELLTKYKMNQFLHNPKGPAIFRIKDEMKEYWINGHIITKEEGEKIEHDYHFGKKIIDTVLE